MIMIKLCDGRVDETPCFCDDDLLARALDLRQPEQHHEDEAEADPEHLQQ